MGYTHYIKVDWPEYQDLQSYEDFDDHAYYCVDYNCYFIEESYYYKKCN